MWQGIPRANSRDPFWQIPAKPCDTGRDSADWNSDDGTCLADTSGDWYYPHPPQVEARCSPPSGSPALPSDAVPIGCADITEMVGGSCPQNICMAPSANGTSAGGCSMYIPKVYNAPWLLDAYKAACIAANGRFSDDYRKEFGISVIVSPP
jgi:hypothetical protein